MKKKQRKKVGRYQSYSKVTALILEQFENGTFNVPLIASRLDKTKEMIWKYIREDDQLLFIFSEYKLAQATEREKRRKAIAESAKEIGTTLTALKFNTSSATVLRCIHEQRDNQEIMQGARKEDKKTKYYKPGFYF